MTILGPILSSALFILPAYLATLPEDDRTVTILDQPGLLDFDRGKESIRFRYLPPTKFSLEQAKEFFANSSDYALLYIPYSSNNDPDILSKGSILFSKGDVSLGVESYVQNQLDKYIQAEKLKAQGVDPDILARTKTRVHLRTINIEAGKETESLAPVKMGIGYIAAFLIYLFVFIYGSQVMRGVIEEKTSRIVEVMISSVKPYQLMAGKIFGLAGVALLQFIIWVVFGVGIYLLTITFVLGNKLDAAQVAANGAIQNVDNDMIFKIVNTIEAINFPYIIGCFLFFFIFGYLLYAALFAAVGSAVDKESDTQQFMFPISLPLIAGIIVLIRALDNPDGPIAFWFSMIPFTSPIVMMARVPFNIPAWELALSMTILVVTFVVITWLAARIYRTGILMYGKKPKFKELLRWISYKG
jgi:ABC-2 type transport system permease protein